MKKRKVTQTRSRALATTKKYRGGFVPSKPTWGAVRREAGRIVKEGLRREGVDIDRVSRMLKGAKLPSSTQIGSKIAGTVYSVAQEYVSGGGSNKKSPFLQMESVGTRNIGAVQVKKHHTKFEHGKTNPSAIRTLTKIHGATTYPFLDTIRNASWGSGTANRDHMTVTSGFNRKVITSFKRMNWDVEDIYDTANLQAYKTPATKLQTNYLAVKNLWRKITIVNTSRFLKATYKIRLMNPNDTNINMSQAMGGGFHTDTELATGTQLDNYVPIRYQLDGVLDDGNDGAIKVWVDPKINITTSPTVSLLYDTAKTFTKTLGPGDSWTFHEIFHTGSGMDVDELVYQRLRDFDAEIGYALVIEAVGQEVGACYAPNSNENFVGTAPVYYQVEFSKGAEYVNSPHSSQSGFTETTNGGVVASNWMIRSFTNYRNQELSTAKIFNVPIGNITDDPTNTANGKLFIPIMTDTNINYAQRAREGGTGGDPNV